VTDHYDEDVLDLARLKASVAEFESLEKLRVKAEQLRARQTWAGWLADGTVAYADFLDSPVWRVTRRQALVRAGFRCQWVVPGMTIRCGSRHRLEVHHLTYARIGDEDPDDLVVLCRAHHLSAHGRDR
jgi:hypothetical protein